MTNINSLNDVYYFVKKIISEGVNFHPDDDFFEIVNYKTGESVYSMKEAEYRNRLADKCFEYCKTYEKDFYLIALEIFQKETGIDKYITNEKYDSGN